MNKSILSSFTLALSVMMIIGGLITMADPEFGTTVGMSAAGLAIGVVLAVATWRLRVAVKKEDEAAAKIRKEKEDLYLRQVREEARLAREEEERQRREQEAAELAKKLEAEQKQAELVARMDDYLNSIPAADVVVSETLAKKKSVSLIDELKFSTITSRTDPASLGDFVAFDVETTGLSPSSAEIVEIAAIRFRGFEPEMKFEALCGTLRGIPVQAEEINGISEEMVEDKPTFQQIADSFRDFIGNDNLVAHNLEFDLKFIVRYGVDVAAEKRRYYDTLRISQRTVKKAASVYADGVVNYKLGTLASYYGIPLFNAHRALADCYAAGRLFESLVKDRTDALQKQ